MEKDETRVWYDEIEERIKWGERCERLVGGYCTEQPRYRRVRSLPVRDFKFVYFVMRT